MEHHTVEENPEQYSLLEILSARYDTVFSGKQYDTEQYIPPYKPVVQDEYGNWYDNPHDHISTRQSPPSADTTHSAILVADSNHKNCNVTHSDTTHLPHLIGLYVREPYREQGIATSLIHDYMSTTEHDTCVVHADPSLKPFYDSLDCDVVFL
ncbi:GNAT family N-acetyltransferase [Halorubrum halophilum]|uniref:GNAT family N-acetyltransferase n=1 Tax=Halorubrum halophilum TaxID=413816 RepID=UPI00186B2C99|nr:GNAT family N-acetyltransferase [Halorubrum halophilum]